MLNIIGWIWFKMAVRGEFEGLSNIESGGIICVILLKIR